MRGGGDVNDMWTSIKDSRCHGVRWGRDMSNKRRRRTQNRKGGARGGGSDIIDVSPKESTNSNPSPDISTIDRNNNHDRWWGVQLSKLLSWVLLYTGPSLGLKLALDGLVPLADVILLTHPRFRCGDGRPKYTMDDVARVVQNCNKQRFRLDYKDNLSDANPSSRDTISADDHADDCTTEKPPCLECCTSNGNNRVLDSVTLAAAWWQCGGSVSVSGGGGRATVQRRRWQQSDSAPAQCWQKLGGGTKAAAAAALAAVAAA